MIRCFARAGLHFCRQSETRPLSIVSSQYFKMPKDERLGLHFQMTFKSSKKAYVLLSKLIAERAVVAGFRHFRIVAVISDKVAGCICHRHPSTLIQHSDRERRRSFSACVYCHAKYLKSRLSYSRSYLRHPLTQLPSLLVYGIAVELCRGNAPRPIPAPKN